MTTQELQEHLKWLVEDIRCRHILIETDMYYIEHKLNKYKEFNIRPFVLAVEKDIKKEREAIARERATLDAWSQLIDNETHRHIFIDHYLNGMKWQDIEDKYHYSTSTVFDINRKCCEAIARKNICEIVPDCNTKTAQTI